MSQLDPVEVLAGELRKLRLASQSLDSDEEVARRMLAKVWAQDWRIVRLDEAGEILGAHVDATATWLDGETTWTVTAEWEPVT